MTLSPLLFLIVCPLTGLAGFVDAVERTAQSNA